MRFISYGHMTLTAFSGTEANSLCGSWTYLAWLACWAAMSSVLAEFQSMIDSSSPWPVARASPLGTPYGAARENTANGFDSNSS